MAATARLGKSYDVVLPEDPSNPTQFEEDQTHNLKRKRAQQGNFLTRRTLLEKILIVAFILVIIIFIIFIVLVQRKTVHHEAEEVCQTKPCIIAAADLLNSMNPSLNPCEDFYDYVCQTWVERETLLDTTSANKFTHLTTDLQAKLKDTMDHEYPESELPDHFRDIIYANQQCMDLETREQASLEPLLKDVKNFGGFPALLGDKWVHSGVDYLTVLSKMLDSGFDNRILFSVGLEEDMMNTSRELLAVTQITQGMAAVDWFQMDRVLENYGNYTSQNAKMLCKEMEGDCTASDDEIDKEIREAVLLEKRIVAMMYPEEFTTDKQKVNNVMRLKELKVMAQEVDWLRLFKIFIPNAKISEESEVLVLVPGFVRKMSRLLGELTSTLAGRRTLVNYMVYRQVNEAGRHLTAGMKRAFHDFEGHITGKASVPDTWKDCVNFIMKYFDFSLASKYVRKYFPPGRRKAIQDLVDNLKNELVIMLKETKWLDQKTKQAAIRKVHSIYVMPGYPDNLLDDSVQDKYYASISTEALHYTNYKLANIFKQQKSVETYGKHTDKSHWHFFPTTILDTNAFYHGSNNTIFVPLGVTQDWFFEDRAPSYVNYGRMAFVLGHELSHAFDVSGAAEDEHGNLKNWWQNRTFEQFLKKSSCMVKMFNSYIDKQANKSVNGEQTVKENIADDTGVIEVYGAFKKTLEKNPPLPLPGLKLTVEQLFWLNYASIWCLKGDAASAQAVITSDEHSPARFRVNSPLSNNHDFLRDFKCKPGDGMYRTLPHCHVWGADSGTQ